MPASGTLSNVGADLALSVIFKIGTPTLPTDIYLGLTTVVPTKSDTLSTVTEVSDTGYTRLQPVFATPADDAGARATSGTTALIFGPFDTSGIGVVGGFITDVASGTSGRILAVFDLDTTKFTNAGDPLIVAADTGLTFRAVGSV